MKITRSKIVVVDFETYWSNEYTLSSPEYNTSSYVRDKQFKIHCMGIKIGNGKIRMAHNQEEAGKILKTIDWSTHALLAQNTSFDGFIIAWHFGIVPCFYLDTMSMTRGLHNDVTRANLAVIAPFYGVGQKSKTYLTPTKGLRDLSPLVRKGLEEGCIGDVELCYGIAMKQLDAMPQEELELVDLTIRMFCDSPLVVDKRSAEVALREELMQKHHAIKQSGVGEDVLQSNSKFAKALEALGVDPPQKISHRTGIHTYSFSQSDEDFMDLQEHPDEAIRKLIAGRLAAKSTQMETRSYRLLQAGEKGNVLPVGYNYYAAKTGRWGGTNKLNLQNLPRVNKDEPKASDGLRRSILAPVGHVLVICDSAQIEARVNAWQAGQEDLLDIFREKRDPYSELASIIYNRMITKADKLERFVGKTAVLGLGYNMGHIKFQTTLALGINGPVVHMELHDCKRIVNIYRGTNTKIVKSWDEGRRMLGQMCAGREGEGFGGLVEFDPNAIWLPNGMPMNYPNLTMVGDNEYRFKAHGKVKKVYGGLVVENLVQALSRIIVAKQMLRIRDELTTEKWKKGEIAKVVMMTHDEVVACVPARMAKATQRMMLEAMRWVPEGFNGLPLDAESTYARHYSK